MDFDSVSETLKAIQSNYLSTPTIILLLLTGVYLTVGLRLISVTKIPFAFGQLFRKRDPETEGDVSPFGALMTALSSTIGTGNIAGVAAAIAIGGPGAVFWMWMTAIVGTATKYSEGVLAIKFRETDKLGQHVGGPMYYIKNGLGKGWGFLGIIFALLAVLASWGTGASIQAITVSDSLESAYNIDPLITAIALSLGAAAVILGGIKRIANVASGLVPTMALFYVGAGLLVIFINIENVPAAFSQIFSSAFGFQSAGTGISIGLIMLAMQKGVARGLFSNEAGQGSAPIAHAAAKNNDPVNQGIIAMLGTIIDTLIVCTITALVILTSGLMTPECLPSDDTISDLLKGVQADGCLSNVPLTAAAFDSALGNIGHHIVTLGQGLFAFTTILGWSYYGERSAEFLFGEKVILPFRISWILVVFFSALAAGLSKEGSGYSIVNVFWIGSDILTGLMAAPNLLALLLLSPLVFKLTQDYFKK